MLITCIMYSQFRVWGDRQILAWVGSHFPQNQHNNFEYSGKYKKFEKNFKKFKTRTGALSNDRVNERTTIPKRNGKRNT